ncbi:MAG: NUDIX hydrolase [Candidatus Cloacimonetes bacterium]|nr:NUDIX hydrolase [Candidatus Cloacimonadota bacterium]
MIDIERYKNINFCIVCGGVLVIKKDKENKNRPICESCGWIFYKNHIPAVACVVLDEINNKVLLVKRKYEPQIGFWALPSGYMEIWQTPEEAAIDELREETGLIGVVDSFIGYYSGYSPIYERVLSLGFRMKIIGGVLEAGDDALEAVFYDIEKMPEIAFWSHQDFLKKSGIMVKETIKMI